MTEQPITALSLLDVTFSYARRLTPVFENLNISFEAGHTYALTGPSGSGKSTLLYVCGLLVTPTSGQVLLDGHDVANLGDAGRSKLRAEQFGFVFQDAMLDQSRTVLDNVIEGGLYTPDATRRSLAPRASDLLHRFGIDDRARFASTDISGGQAQRVGLCRALIKRSAVILADEPTGNLDPDNSAVVVDSLLAAASTEGSVVIIATHIPGIADRCDQVIELNATVRVKQ